MLRHLSLPLTQTTCFFCQSHINPPPRDSRNFKCPHCQCWNRYDKHGEIISDEPAMHDPGLNARSFAKRGRPLVMPKFRTRLKTGCTASSRKDRFLPSYGKPLFCHTCQTNQVRALCPKTGQTFCPNEGCYQMLLTNLLANYLPSPEVRSRPFAYTLSLTHVHIGSGIRRKTRIPSLISSLRRTTLPASMCRLSPRSRRGNTITGPHGPY